MSMIAVKGKAKKATPKAKAPKAGKVSTTLDNANGELVSSGYEFLKQGTGSEAIWFADSVALLNAKKISVRGIQESMKEVLAKFTDTGDVKFPSLTETMVQYFLQASALMALEGWKGSPVEAIRLVQSGKRSEKFASAKDFDKALAVAKTAKAITAKAKAPKRAGKSNTPTGTRQTAESQAAYGKRTIEQGIGELLAIFTERTDHTIKDMKAAERLAGVLAQAIANTKANAKKASAHPAKGSEKVEDTLKRIA
jgi:peroxiredoxin